MGERMFVLYIDEVKIHHLPEDIRLNFYFEIYHQNYIHPSFSPISGGYQETLCCLIAKDEDVFATMKFVTNQYLDCEVGRSIFREFALSKLLDAFYEGLKKAGFDISSYIFITKDPCFFDLEKDVFLLNEFECYYNWPQIVITQVWKNREWTLPKQKKKAKLKKSRY